MHVYTYRYIYIYTNIAILFIIRRALVSLTSIIIAVPRPPDTRAPPYLGATQVLLVILLIIINCSSSNMLIIIVSSSSSRRRGVVRATQVRAYAQSAY